MPPARSLIAASLAVVLASACNLPAAGPAPTTPQASAGLSALTGPASPPPLAAATPPHPARSPGPSASPTSSPDPDDWREGDLIQFEAPQRPGDSRRDLFVYNARLETVVALVGANSPADETSPKLSSDRQWLAFQRTTPAAPGGRADADVMLFNTRTQMLNRLPSLNSAAFDETSPDLSGDGRWLAYVVEDGVQSEVRVYDVSTGADDALPGLNRAFAEVDDPRFSHDNRRLLFSAATRLADGGTGTSDLYLYDLSTATLFEVPFVNTPFNEANPDLHPDDRRLLFTSDRRGTRDIFEADLETGHIDDLPFANTDRFDEASPRYYGKDRRLIRFRVFPDPVEAPSAYQLRIFDPSTARVDTVPVGNRLLIAPF